MHIAKFMCIKIKPKQDGFKVVMERRAFERIPASIDARYFYGNMFYTGTVVNLSEKGLFINTKRCLPSNSIIMLIIRLNNKLLKIPAKVKRYVRTNSCYDGMGVELINRTVDYSAFVDGLKMDLQKV
jgi:hypothetical protein